MAVLQIRLSAEEMAKFTEAAKGEGLSVAAFARGILFPSVGVERSPRREVAPKPANPRYKRSPKCESGRCLRLQLATCPACIVANTAGFDGEAS